jgi:hypothetical protein
VLAGEALARVAEEFLPHAERQRDEADARPVRADEPHDLQLRAGLVQAEGGEERAPPAGERPAHHRAGVILERRVQLERIHVEAAGVVELHLRLEEGAVVFTGRHPSPRFFAHVCERFRLKKGTP